MRFTMPILAAMLAAFLAFDAPRPLYAQSKEMQALTTLQRDLYDVRDMVTKGKSGQDEKLAELQTQIKQLMDANSKISSDLRGVQDKVTTSQAEQAKNVAGPISDLKRAIDDLSGALTALGNNQNKMTKSAESMASTLSNIDAQMRLLQSTMENMKPQAPVVAAPSPDQAAQLAFAAAELERATGKPEFALKSLIDVASTYATSPYAPLSWFKVGQIYSENEQYPDALDAYDRVLERFGDNPVRGQAQLAKADTLAKMGRREDAIREYNAVIRTFSGALADDATAKIEALKPPPAAPAPAKGKQKSPKKAR
jgi:tetratricopeptide (TPR) repeat protein